MEKIMVPSIEETIEDIRSGLNTNELIHIIWKVCFSGKLIIYSLGLQQILCEATLLNRTELIYRILTISANCQNSLLNQTYPRPLFYAMREGNLSLVEFFLEVGSSLSIVSECPTPRYVPCLKMWFHSMTAVEYACMLDRPDILQLLLRYDVKEEKEGDKALHYAALHGAFNCVQYLLTVSHFLMNINAVMPIASYDYDQNWARLRCSNKVTPIMAGAIHGRRMAQMLIDAGASISESSLLNIIVGQADHYCLDGRAYELPAVVGLIINGGANIEETIERFHFLYVSPLDKLMSMILYCESKGQVLTIEDIKAFEDTAQLLLPVKPHIRTLYRLLRSDFFHIVHEKLKTSESYACIRAKLYSVFAKAIKQLLKQGELNDSNSSYKLYARIMENAHVVVALERLVTSSFLPHLKVIMDSLSDIFHSLLLARIGRNTTDFFLDTCFRDDMNVLAFIMIAGYSSKFNGSDQLIRHILHSLSGSQTGSLLKRIEYFSILFKNNEQDSDNDPIVSLAVDRALKCVRQVQIPRSLEHLAGCVVTRALSYRSLDEGCLLGLQIPKHLHASILL